MVVVAAVSDVKQRTSSQAAADHRGIEINRALKYWYPSVKFPRFVNPVLHKTIIKVISITSISEAS
jgi:hypothetical protein